jgi:DNA-binding response OmpR family regulator
MSKPSILIIEDDPAIRRGLSDAVQFGGYLSIEAADGLKGVPLALSSECSLVLLDVMLPGKDGFLILEELRIHRPHEEPATIAGRDIAEEPDRSVDLGHQQVGGAIIVEVGEHQGAVNARLGAKGGLSQ